MISQLIVLLMFLGQAQEEEFPKLLWKRDTAAPSFGSGALGDIDGDKAVRALDGKDGTELWKRELDGHAYHGVSVLKKGGVHVVATSTAGDVRLIDAKGKEVWKKKIEGYMFAPSTVADLDGDGTLDVFFVCGKGTSDKERRENYGRAFALRAGKGKGSWTTFRGDNVRTGFFKPRREW